MKVKVAKWGNSLGVRLPKAAAAAAGLVPGTELEVEVEGNALRMVPAARIPRYRLADLIAEIDRLGPENEPETVDWGPDRGAEILPDDAYSRGEIRLEDLTRGTGPTGGKRNRKRPKPDAPRSR